MSGQTSINTPLPSTEDCHHTAVRAILHLIDRALSRHQQLSRQELDAALDTWAQQGTLKKIYKGNLTTYDKQSLKQLAQRLIPRIRPDATNDNSWDTLLRCGSSCINEEYLTLMGMIRDDDEELSDGHYEDDNQITVIDSATLGGPGARYACTGLKFSPGCEKDKPVELIPRGHLARYCRPCTMLFDKEAQKSIGCNNPEALPQCEGRNSRRYRVYDRYLLCRKCDYHFRKPKTDRNSNKRPAELSAGNVSRNLRIKKSDTSQPAATSLRLRTSTSVVPDSTTSSFDPSPTPQSGEVARNTAAQEIPRGNDTSELTVLVEKHAAMLRLLRANNVSDAKMLGELLTKARQPQLPPSRTGTRITSFDIVDNHTRGLHRSVDTSISKTHESSFLNKQWNDIHKILRSAADEFLNEAGVDINHRAELCSMPDTVNLRRLYERLFGTDPEGQNQIFDDQLCKTSYVLWALLGAIVYAVADSGDLRTRMQDFADAADPRLELLAENIEEEEEEGHSSIAILRRANSAWILGAAFAHDVVHMAQDLCMDWIKKLRSHLHVVYNQGNQHLLKYTSLDMAFQVELDSAIYKTLLVSAQMRNAGGYKLVWFPSQTAFNELDMIAEHEKHGDKVYMTIFPGIQRTVNGSSEVVFKARVICTCPEKEVYSKTRSLLCDDGDGDGDCYIVTPER